MICLDANYLIRTLVPNSDESQRVMDWYRDGMVLCASSVAWYEFLCGPVSEKDIRIVRALLSGGVIGFETKQADKAASLFNDTGRIRNLKVDAMIAACAICANAKLATDNLDDFRRFVPFGLSLTH